MREITKVKIILMVLTLIMLFNVLVSRYRMNYLQTQVEAQQEWINEFEQQELKIKLYDNNSTKPQTNPLQEL